MSSFKGILSVLAGVATGAALGILFAPEKGSQTRKNIAAKGKGYTDELKNKYNAMYEKANNKYESVVSDAKEFVSNEAKNVVAKLDTKLDQTKLDQTKSGFKS